MEQKISPQEVLKIMVARDKFTAWLGLQIDEIREGYCRLHYTVKEDMLNGFERIHGGVLFSAADSAFAFACNSHGLITVALDVSITFTRPVFVGEKLFVEAQEIHLSNKTGLYDIRTLNENGELVCLFKGTAYRTSKEVTPVLHP
jgi:acyl-CoA thioesterase